jgi:PAS domain S-box-containing protein
MQRGLHTDLRAAALENLVELAPDAMLVVDSAGIILYANRQVERLFGCARAEILGQPVECLLPERFRARHGAHRGRFAAEGRTRPMGAGLELYGRRWDGQEFPVEISLSPLDDGLAAAAIRDVTDRKHAERELIAAGEIADAAREIADAAREEADRANLAKSRFLATASHDLRQPLQALAMWNGILRRMPLDLRAVDAVGQQEHAIDSMKRLLNALLDISKLESGAIQPERTDFGIAALLENLRSDFAGMAAAKNIELRVESAALFANSDLALVEQLLRNLLSNAIKYTRAGAVGLRSFGTERTICIEVMDTGIGIPADQLGFIYDEFFQVGVATNSTRDGYGLGLAIVKRIVQLLGAHLDVRSEIGRGTKFVLELPVGKSGCESPSIEPAAAAAGARPQRAARILLVEDEPGVRLATRLLLETEGYVVVTAASRAEALAGLAPADDVDALVTDYHLEGNATGLDVITALRASLGRRLPAVLVTGDTSTAMRKVKNESQLRVASKPIDAEELLTMLRELLEIRSGSVESAATASATFDARTHAQPEGIADDRQ